MWVEILCGLVVYKLFRRFLIDDDSVPDFDSSDSDLFFAVANRLEKLYGGKAYVGLRIPDAETGSRQTIDVVLVTKAEMMVIAVKNISGFVEIDNDGRWVCTGGKKHRKETYPDPVAETKKQVEILESYMEQRAASLPKGYLSSRVILPNPNCRVTYSINSLPEIILFDNWSELKQETRSGFSSWIKDAFRGGKKELDGFYQNINYILSTAPMWDRLVLKGDRNILGEFVEFKGNGEDMQALMNVKRSKVSSFIIQKSIMFGVLGNSKVQLLYAPRDYRSEGASASEWKDATVKSSTEVLFQPLNSKKAKKIKLSKIVSLSFSA